MDRKIRVGAVSYLNTKPLLYGIEHSPVFSEMTLITEFPARIADRLLMDEIDIGLVPVAMIPHLVSAHLNTDYCIGCDGPVASVCLFSEVPLDEIKIVKLDYQSRTSVALVKILFQHHWKQQPEFQSAGSDFLDEIEGGTAAVVIGDRALHQRKVSKYVYDLGEAWKQMTGLPFVFAAWISNKPLDSGWINRFNEANAYGVKHIPEVLKKYSSGDFDLQSYYTRYLSYDFDERKKQGLRLFLKLLAEQNHVL